MVQLRSPWLYSLINETIFLQEGVGIA